MIHLLVCECLTELDTRVGILICLICTFSQSILGAMHLPFPYLLLPCLGIFLAIYFTMTLKQVSKHQSSFLMGFFMLQQICSLYALLYLFPLEQTYITTILNSFFIATGTIGALLSYHLKELIRQPLIITNLSIL